MRTLRRIGVPIALIAAFTVWLSGACPKGAHAQGCICVVDVVTEKEMTITATSVTTGGGAGIYKSNSAYISNLNSTQLSGINPGNFGANFPGWATLPPNSSAIAQAVSGLTLTTYASALADAQSQMGELAAESFSGIEQENASALALLYAVQLNTEVGLQIVNQLQLVRQLLADLVVVEAVDHGERLNERAREQATNATQFNLGFPP
jgi:hypothetical protein